MNAYLGVEQQLRSHPNIVKRAGSGFMNYGSSLGIMLGDTSGVWKMRDTGSPLDRRWNRHWNVGDDWHFWIYAQLCAGNVDAIYQLGPGTGINLGELYIAFYSCPTDQLGFFVMSTKTGKRIGMDTGWRPIEVRGDLYRYCAARFTFW